jgi:hypothetical protein
MSGYMHSSYAASLAEYGAPQELTQCGGWILRRRIPGSDSFDAMGCYPLFNCSNWSALAADLESISNDFVSITLVTDPFGKYNLSILETCFKDKLMPFKQHFVVELGNRLKMFVSDHHQRNVRKALKVIQVERCDCPESLIDDWVGLYHSLVKKHQIKGIADFSKAAFLQQLRVPGIIAFRATYEGLTVGILLWYVWQDVGYYHLAAYSDLGYKLRASFALFWLAFEYFSDCDLKWLNLGAGSGIRENSSEGLSRFKRGWATGTRTAYLCGRVFDTLKYCEFSAQTNTASSDYFPAYRKGEF